MNAVPSCVSQSLGQEERDAVSEVDPRRLLQMALGSSLDLLDGDNRGKSARKYKLP